MREHVHWGFTNVIFAGVSAIIVMNVLRLIAVAVDDKFPAVTHIIGGALNFGPVSTRNEVSNN
jgi:hypothetical protein